MSRDLNDTLIFVKVVEQGSFIAAANQVQVGYRFVVKAAKRIHSFGREIDPPLRRRGGDKEHGLRRDEFLHCLV